MTNNRTLFLAVAAATVAHLLGIAAIILATQGGASNATLLAAVAAATLGFGAFVVAVMWLRGYRSATNTRATRIANLERRVASIIESTSSDRNAASRELQSVRSELRALEARLEEAPAQGAATAEPTAPETTASLVALGSKHGVPLQEFLTQPQAVGAVREALRVGAVLDCLPYLDAFPTLLDELTLSESRTLLKGLRRLGYLGHAVPVIDSIAARFGNPADARAAALYASELALYRGELDLEVEFPELEGPLERDTVLHIVGKALPETQSGYTLRTQYTVEAQQRLGVRPIVVAQAGASDRPHQHTETYEHRGIRYYLLGGPQRGAVQWDAWLRANVLALAEVVRVVRPAAIHTHSDFMNAMIALHVARAYGIPLVNETRGFWEESWLSRTANAENWADLAQLEQRFGMPDMYNLRVEREAQLRSESDAVVTLARVMREHIEEIGNGLGLPNVSVSIAPNAVQTDDFPVIPASAALREELGFGESTIVVGYISSIVEYEGIDTLVRAMFELEAAVEAARALTELATWSVSAVEAEVGTDLEQADAEFTPAEIAQEPAAPLNALKHAVALATRDFGPGALPADVPPHEDIDDVGGDDRERVLESLDARLRLLHADDDDATLRERGAALLALAAPFQHADLRLMIVGDGAELTNLRNLATELGVRGAVFTGRVPHENVLDYYGLIDLFAVPRKRAAVTELVTPLKPFEALSTGRPCIFSDVSALAEIAQDSGCVELFRADDHHHLATKIGGLLGDPERLATMALAGAEWVRNERTWDMNALTYLSVYQSLGLAVETPAAASELLALREEGVGARTITHRLRSGAEPRATGWFLLEAKRYPAAKIIEEGWRIAKHPAIRFEPGMDWEEAGRQNRSWGFHLHAWEFLDPALQEYAETRDEELLRWMFDVALDWWASVQGVEPQATMAWYDMSLSLRMPRLARLMIAVAKSSFADETVRLIRPALEHVRQSTRDEAFNAGNNHGFFAAAAAIDFARWLSPLPGSEALHELGAQRMKIMLARQFAEDGGHLEHSPDYHRMLLQSFERALEEGLVEDEDTAARIERAARVLGWLVQPDGALVQFGDSPRFDVEANELTSIDARTRFILTDGREGVPEDEEMLVLPQSGYAIVRAPQPKTEGERSASSYLALQAGFHSRAHKHADDLTFTWFDRGHEILVDAGRFGYVDLLPPDSPDRLKGFYYSAPERQYVESTIAHNTVTVDGKDIERRQRKPYGSALGEVASVDGRFQLRAAVDHGSHKHARVLTLEPGHALEILDKIESDAEGVEAVAWFNMPGELDLSSDSNSLRIVLPSGDRMEVVSNGELVAPVRGGQAPLRGWRSVVDRELVPAWNFGYRMRVDGSASIETTFAFD